MLGENSVWNTRIHAAFQCIFYRCYPSRNDQNVCMTSQCFLHKVIVLLQHSLIKHFKVNLQTKHVTTQINRHSGRLEKIKRNQNIFVSSRTANKFILNFLPVSFIIISDEGQIRPVRVPLFKDQIELNQPSPEWNTSWQLAQVDTLNDLFKAVETVSIKSCTFWIFHIIMVPRREIVRSKYGVAFNNRICTPH